MANRTKNSVKNIASNMGLKLLLLGLQFVTKTLFIRTLGETYLGINTLVSSILSFLNITELGIGAAIVFAMYKPIAEQDEEKVQQYMVYYKRIYHILGLVVLGLGLILLPFLPYFMKGTPVDKTVYIVYALYLINSVSSFYVFSYRGGFLTACQKDYKITAINYTANILSVALQSLALFVFQAPVSFYCFVAVPIFVTILQRTISGLFIAKWYPYIKKKPVGKLSKEEKKALYKNTYGMAIAKIATIINNSVDSIIISAMIGVTVLAHYANYNTLILMVTGFVEILFSSLRASIGNLNFEATKEHNREVFNAINFVAFWIYGFCAICYFCVVQPFIAVWIGGNWLMDIGVPIIVTLNFLTSGLTAAVSIYREACGLYYQGRYRPVFTTIFNIGFSLLLGHFWGIFGIVLATIISRFITIWWFDAYIVFKHVFEQKPTAYLISYMLRLVFIAALGAVCYLICSCFHMHVWLKLLCSGAFTAVFVNGVFILAFRKNPAFQYVVGLMKNQIFARFLRKKHDEG